MKRVNLILVMMLNINIMLTIFPPSVHSETEKKSLTPVTLQLMWKHQFEFAGFYAAIEQGYYQDVGLDVKLREYQNEVNPIEEVVNGQAHYGISDSSLIIDRKNGAPVVLLANIFQHSPMVLLALEKSKIYSPAQMLGKRLMLSKHEKNNASIIAMLHSESISLNQIELIDHTFTTEDLINGHVDVISAYATNEPGLLLQDQVKFNIIDPINYGIDFYGNNIFTSEKELRENPERVAQFIAASLKGWQYALDHSDEIIELILRKYSTEKSRQALAFEAKALERFILPDHIPLGTIDLNRMQRIVDTYEQLSMLSDGFELDKYIYQPVKHNKLKIKLNDEQLAWIKQNPELVVGVDPAWAPFEFISEHGKYSGMGADYLDLIANKTGLNFIIQDNPTWQSVMKNARLGRLDMLSAVMESPQRTEFLDFSTPHIKYPMVIVTAKEASFISSIGELGQKKVAVVKGYVTEDLLRMNHPGIILKPVETLEHGLKLVSSAEVDALVDNLASVTNIVSQLGITNLRISGTTPYQFTLGFAMQKKHRILLEIINRAVESISDQEHQEIRNKWISVNYAQKIDYSKLIEISIGFVLFTFIILFWNRRLAREVKARKIVEEALRNNETQFRNLVENTNIVAWEVALESLRFTYVSPQAEAMLGYPLAEWKKENFWFDHIIEADRQKSFDYCASETSKGRDHAFEYRMYKADGDTIWLRDIVTVNKNDEGKPISLNGVFVDISEDKKYEQMLEKAKSQAETANKVKSEFLATMSHELRTPMNGVLGMAQLLKESSLSTEQHNDVDIILSSGNALLAIINDVLDFSKLEAEQLTLESQVFNLEQLCNDILDMFKSDCQRKSVKITLQYPQNYPRFFQGDPMRLQQILINLIGNAVKFTSEGSVSLIIACQVVENKTAKLILAVEDTGVGIAIDDTVKLFEPFIQADQTTTRKFGGTGLGLAVSKKLILLMNGDIGVDSELGKGSKFWITLSLPIIDGQLIEQKPKPARLEHGSVAGKILLVEDDKVNQLVASGVLRKIGLEVDVAEDGQQAFSLWKAGDYDLIFMDCRMPVLDGYEASKLIREQETDSSIPIIALTANSSPEDKQNCLNSGMNDVITKPFKTDLLFNCVEKWLSNTTRGQTTE